MPKPDPNTLKTPVGSTPQTGVGAGLQYGYPSTLLHPNGVTNANDTTPSWYAPISGAPKPPAGGDTTQKFSTNFQPTGSTAFSKMVQQALDRQQYGQKGVDLQNMPTSFTIADFNNTAQTNPVLAQQMLAKGGQAYRDAVMKANGWTNLQMNQFINAYGSSVEPGITQQNLTEAGFTPDRFGTNTLTPVVSAPPPPVNQPAPPPPASTGATADQGTEPGYGYFSPYWTNLYGGAVR
jgi:hypothetical protein